MDNKNLEIDSSPGQACLSKFTNQNRKKSKEKFSVLYPNGRKTLKQLVKDDFLTHENGEESKNDLHHAAFFFLQPIEILVIDSLQETEGCSENK